MNILYFIIFSTIDLIIFAFALVMSIRDNLKYKRLIASNSGEVLFDIKHLKKKAEKIFAILFGLVFVIDKSMAIWTQRSGIYLSGIVFLLTVWVSINSPEIYIFSNKIKYKLSKNHGGQEGEAFCDDIASISVSDEKSIISTVCIKLKSQEKISVMTKPQALIAAEKFCEINNIDFSK
jgi:hypothetical protein